MLRLIVLLQRQSKHLGPVMGKSMAETAANDSAVSDFEEVPMERSDSDDSDDDSRDESDDDLDNLDDQVRKLLQKRACQGAHMSPIGDNTVTSSTPCIA